MSNSKANLYQIFACIVLFGSVYQLNAQETSDIKEDYHFKQNSTPIAIPDHAGISVIPFSGKEVRSLGNAIMADFNDPVTQVNISPTGFCFVTVNEGKKHGEAYVVVTNEYNNFLYKHNVKKHGSPVSATFTPDAKKLIIASDNGINIFESKKFTPIDSFPSSFVPKQMAMSNNGYYLAMTDGNKVEVYNFEDKRLRKKWDIDAKVNDFGFSPDNTEFAVLTDDGLLSIYDTRNFTIKKNIEGVGEGLSFDYNPDGKYVAVMTSPVAISVINLLDDNEREHHTIPGDGSDVKFLTKVSGDIMLAYTATNSVGAKTLTTLEPHYSKLVSDRADEMMNEWLKMMPGETMEEYRKRVNDESRIKQRRLFEDEISTELAGDLVSMSKISLGKYDRGNQMLAVEFDNMPPILLPVPEASVSAFSNVEDLTVNDAKYGIMPNDNFELIYAKFHNRANNETYIYDNLDRVPLNFMEGDDNLVSLEVLQQQQMEEVKLQELKQKVVEEAKQKNVISDHTHIAVDSRVVSDYDADGKKILNYVVKFSYEVEPDYSLHEDFGPGKYHVSESGAASSMLSIVKQAFEGDMAQYIADGKKIIVKISGAADGTPVRRVIPYDGSYGDFENEPVYKDNGMATITVTKKDGITQNEQLAFLRGYGVKDYLEKNIENLDKMKADYQYHISVAEGKGSEFRRIVAEFTLVDAF